MKSTFLALTAVLATGSAFAQGTVNFSTRATAAGVDAKVFYAEQPGGAATAVGSAYMGQLYFAPAGGAMAPVDAATPFRDGNFLGYITKGAVTVAGVPGGTSGTLELRAWKGALGATYEAALAAGGGNDVGKSLPINITLGGAGNPPSTPPNLVGLQSFTVVVPEPSIAALGLLGAGLLLIRRKK